MMFFGLSCLSWEFAKGYWLEPSISSLSFICCVKISFNFCNHSCCEGTTSVSPVTQLAVRKVSGCTVCGTFITKRIGLARFAGGYSRLSFGLRIGCFFGSLESEETHLNGEE